MSTMPLYLKMLELDAYTTASPLAAQYLVANHYHLAPRVEIREAATGDPATEKVVAGRMHFDLMSPSNAIQLIGKAIWPRCGFRASGIAGQRSISQAARPKPTSLPG